MRLQEIVCNIPKFNDTNLLVGFDTSDDGAVYKLSEDLAIITTLDFFPPMVEDPYIFGKIAAANALSDIYAMGGEVKTALNIVCFPEEGDFAILGEILRGGAEKVAEAGGVLCGGHSINDKIPKYGLSVTGTVHPDKIMYNNRCQIGDRIILTKPLGVGIVTSAYKSGAASKDSFGQAVDIMQHLNKYALEIAKKYRIHSCTDVTGFGFLGHLNEMIGSGYSIYVEASKVLYIEEAEKLASEHLITGGGAKNRRFLQGASECITDNTIKDETCNASKASKFEKVSFKGVSMAMEEILFDPQTSGGLLISVHKDDSEALLAELAKLNQPCSLVGEVIPVDESNVIVTA